MTVATSTSKSGPYAGAGTTGPFTVDFRFLENAHLLVVKTSALGVETVLVLDTDYTVAGAGATSGTVTLAVALPSGQTLTIVRNVPATQEADYVQNDAFPAESHERALDKLTMIGQQNREQISRSMKLPVSLEGVSTEMPVPVAGRGLKWNAGGTAVVNSDQDFDAIAAAAAGSAAAAAVSAAAAAASYDAFDDRFLGVKASDPALDNDGAALTESALYWNSVAKEFRVFNGTTWQVVVPSGNLQKITFVDGVDFTAGVTTTLSLPTDPLVKANLDIVFDAAWQQMTEYSLSGLVVTFNAPIPVGVAQIEISYTIPLQITSLQGPDGVLLVGNAADKRDLAASTGATLIGWIRTATGAVATTLAKWMGWQVPTVFDFMTAAQVADVQAGTFLLDVSAPCQAALDALDVVRFPAGGYYIATALTPKANQLIYGDGNATHIQTINGSINGFYVTASGVTIRDLKISTKSQTVATAYKAGVMIYGTTYCVVENVLVFNWGHWGVALYDASNCIVRNNRLATFFGAVQDSADIAIYNNSNYNTVEGNHCNGAGADHGILLQDPYSGATPTGNKIINNNITEHNADGILAYVTTVYDTKLLIAGNHVRDILGTALAGLSGHGIYIQSAGGSIVTDNVIENCCRSTTGFETQVVSHIGVGADVGDRFEVIVSNNHINAPRGPGVYVATFGVTVIVSGNTINSTGTAAVRGEAIRALNADGVKIINNKIRHANTNYDAIQLGATAATVITNADISGNNIKTAGAGIATSVGSGGTIANVTVSNNTVLGGSGAAFNFDTAANINMCNNIGESTGIVYAQNACLNVKASNNRLYSPSGTSSMVFSGAANSNAGTVFNESNTLSIRLLNSGGTGAIIGVFGNAAPFIPGTCGIGDYVIQSVPVVGQPKGWRATVSANPGTWVSEGDL